MIDIELVIDGPDRNIIFEDRSIKSTKYPEKQGLYIRLVFNRLEREQSLMGLPELLRKKADDAEKILKRIIEEDRKDSVKGYNDDTL